MPMRGELPTKKVRTYVAPSPSWTAWLHFVTAISDPEIQTIIALCIIGILATLDAVLRFPDLGGLIADLNSFP
jgi:PhoPQ-activated pathogenicity-related protein